MCNLFEVRGVCGMLCSGCDVFDVSVCCSLCGVFDVCVWCVV